MANGEFEEITDRIAGDLRKLIDDPKEDRRFWDTRPYHPVSRRDKWPLGPRELELKRNLRAFRSAVRLLHTWQRKTMPGIYFKNGSLPSSPENSRLILSNDPVSTALREAWAVHRELRSEARRDHADEGSVIEIPLEESIRVFSNGLANAIVTAAASRTTGLVHFTVNSQHSDYRVHLTEQYWYSPVAFGSNLSTPVDDMVFPANYRFGGDKSGGPIIWDSGIHTASASHTSTTVMNF